MLRRFVLAVLVLAAAITVRAQSIEIPFWPTYTGDRWIVLGVKLNGHGPYPFLLDSCAGMNVIDDKLLKECGAAEIGKTKVNSGGTKSVDGHVFSIARLDVGDAILTNTASVEGAVADPDYFGLLGIEFLRKYVVQIDFDRRVLIATPAADFQPGANDTGLPMMVGPSGLPLVGGSVDGLAGRFLLDTGNARGFMLHANFVRRYRLDANRKTAPATPLSSMTGLVFAKYVRLHTLDLGPFSIRGQVALLLKSPSDSADYADGNIGVPELRRFHFTIDLPHRLLYLGTGARYAEPVEAPRVGISWRTKARSFVVDSVLPGSPAEQMGIVPGDDVVDVDGLPTANLSWEDIDVKFSGPAGTEVRLTVKRKGALKTVKVRLRDLI